jgi:hypothetical protein
MKKLVIAMCSLSLLAGGALTNAKDAAEQEEHKMGQPFTLGDYTYTITKFEPKRKIGTKYHNKEAEHGAKFLVVRRSPRKRAPPSLRSKKKQLSPSRSSRKARSRLPS